jgi:hypothetical protein
MNARLPSPHWNERAVCERLREFEVAQGQDKENIGLRLKSDEGEKYYWLSHDSFIELAERMALNAILIQRGAEMGEPH